MTTDTTGTPPPVVAVAAPPGATAVPARPGADRTGPGASEDGSRSRRLLKHSGLVAASLVMLYPVLWMVVSSLRPEDEIFRSPSIVPDAFEVVNYVDGWNALAQPFSTYLFNSAVLVVGAIVGNLLSCSLAAYAFARLQFRFKRTMFAIMLLTIMIPVHVIIVPQYIAFSQMGLVNTVWPLLLPKFFATESFYIFLMVQFIRGIPRELDEAARIDGCGHWRIFSRVILPLMLPALAATAIFTFIASWNDFFTALIYLTAPDNYTVPLALSAFIDSQGDSNWGAQFAMSIVSLVPVFFAFLVGQKYLVTGFATTGGK